MDKQDLNQLTKKEQKDYIKSLREKKRILSEDEQILENDMKGIHGRKYFTEMHFFSSSYGIHQFRGMDQGLAAELAQAEIQQIEEIDEVLDHFDEMDEIEERNGKRGLFSRFYHSLHLPF